jgi:hypothetical protein
MGSFQSSSLSNNLAMDYYCWWLSGWIVGFIFAHGMALCYNKRGKGSAHFIKASSDAEVVVVSYAIVIDLNSQSFMQTIEENVKVIRAYCDD